MFDCVCLQVRCHHFRTICEQVDRICSLQGFLIAALTLIITPFIFGKVPHDQSVLNNIRFTETIILNLLYGQISQSTPTRASILRFQTYILVCIRSCDPVTDAALPLNSMYTLSSITPCPLDSCDVPLVDAEAFFLPVRDPIVERSFGTKCLKKSGTAGRHPQMIPLKISAMVHRATGVRSQVTSLV
jgi:hypothetical protein